MEKSTHEKILGYTVLALFSGALFYLASSQFYAREDDEPSLATEPSAALSTTTESMVEPSVAEQAETLAVQPAVEPQVPESVETSIKVVEVSEPKLVQEPSVEQPKALPVLEEPVVQQPEPEVMPAPAVQPPVAKSDVVVKPDQVVKAKRVQTVSGYWTVQLGAFSTEPAARAFARQLSGLGLSAVKVVSRKRPQRFVVVCGAFKEANLAKKHKQALAADNIDGFIIHVDRV